MCPVSLVDLGLSQQQMRTPQGCNLATQTTELDSHIQAMPPLVPAAADIHTGCDSAAIGTTMAATPAKVRQRKQR
eukprot:COSAG02_NODE_48990_length_330_cov_0.662338_1_plen_74_part_10